jgi:hypothetical protein
LHGISIKPACRFGGKPGCDPATRAFTTPRNQLSS